MFDTARNNKELPFPHDLIRPSSHLNDYFALVDIERIFPVGMKMPMVLTMKEGQAYDVIIETGNFDGGPGLSQFLELRADVERWKHGKC